MVYFILIFNVMNSLGGIQGHDYAKLEGPYRSAVKIMSE
jgi:hypothetical protein